MDLHALTPFILLSNSAIGVNPSASAMISGETPSLFGVVGQAPERSRQWTISIRPHLLAICKAVTFVSCNKKATRPRGYKTFSCSTPLSLILVQTICESSPQLLVSYILMSNRMGPDQTKQLSSLIWVQTIC